MCIQNTVHCIQNTVYCTILYNVRRKDILGAEWIITAFPFELGRMDVATNKTF